MNNKREIIKVKILASTNKWALTLMLHPDCSSILVTKEQYDFALPDYINKIQTSTFVSNSILSVELTKKGDIHIHALITTCIPMRRKLLYAHMEYLFNQPKSIWGYFFLKPIIDEPGWLNYINKQPFYSESHFYAF